YYKSSQEPKDQNLAQEVRVIQQEHPWYGYRRIALALGVNHKRIQRIKSLYKIQTKYKQKRKFQKK
ncbi:MAG: IS3 family transposase, partial [Patescibacteria group bacterium]|nr:IS3 family transposase [Patescibacteria group bacterium]